MSSYRATLFHLAFIGFVPSSSLAGWVSVILFESTQITANKHLRNKSGASASHQLIAPPTLFAVFTVQACREVERMRKGSPRL